MLTTSRCGQSGVFGSVQGFVDGVIPCPSLKELSLYARSKGAKIVEGYPVDNKGAKVDTIMAYVGTGRLFETAGLVFAAETTSVSGGFARVVMRRLLT